MGKPLRFYGAAGPVFAPSPLPDLGEPLRRLCAECGRPMKRRRSGSSEFWGCTGYPTWCRYTRPIK